MELRIAQSLFLVLFIVSTVYGQECGIVHVSPSGASSGVAGTKANPASFAYGLTLLSPTNSRMWMAAGNYNIDNTITIASNITIEGGFNAATWVKSSSTPTVIIRSAANADVANLALVGFSANGATGFRLQDLTINVANATTPGMSVYGIRLVGCSNYNVTRCAITTGNGAAGATGSAGAAGVAGATGGTGTVGNDDSNTNARGGNGGVGGGAGAGAAGTQGSGSGGNGAAGGTSTDPRAGGGGGGGGAGGYDDDDGGNGGNGGGVSGGAGINTTGGAGGQENGSCNDNNEGDCNSGNIMVGVAGGGGTSGANGTAGAAGGAGAHAAGYYVPATGSAGTPGFGGQGGKGGGGGAGERFRLFDCTAGTGSGGGGGGGGGQGGAGGNGGQGGGSSFAVYVFNNGAGAVIADCALTPGTGGTGGLGGTGGVGGIGGGGGVRGVNANGEVGCGGHGGAGGNGGNGGVGGAGAPGLAVALYEHPGGTAATVVGTQTQPSVPIFVQNTGCLNTPVIFSYILAPSSTQWNFGAGATPPTASGPGPHSVVYSSLGRKTILAPSTGTMIDYVDIFNSSVGSGTFISPGDTTVPVGCFHTFQSTQAGSNYNWTFNGANVTNVNGPAEQVVDSVYFLSPGVYEVILQLTTGTSCCGVLADTILVTAVPNAINVSLAASTATICQGEPITYTASPSNYQQYDFYINTTLIQAGNQNVFTTSALQPGDSVIVRAFDGACYSNPSATIFPTVNIPPSLTLVSSDADNTICAGESVTFTATPTGLGTYTFMDGNSVVQQTASNTYTTTSLVSGNSITVIASSNGCADTSAAIVTVVNPTPTVTLASSDADNIICTGDAVTFTASPAGLAQYDFFENGNPAQSSAINTYTTAALATGTTVTVSAINNGCTSTVSAGITVTVNTYPVVTLVSSDADNSICAGESVTFTASPAGLTSYTFLDGTTVLQQGAQNTYTTTALASGNSITVIGFNANCADTSAAIVTVVNQTPVITLSSSDADNSICAGDAVTFTVIPAGLAQYDFFENGNPVQSSATNTYTTSALATGTSVTATATNNGCSSTVSAAIVVTVNPYPVVTLTSSDADNVICEGTSVTFTASPTGLQQYDFYYINLLQQSGASNTYTTASLLAGNSVYVIANQNGCADTSNAISTQVIPAPVADAGADEDACVDAPLVALSGTPSGGTWSGSVVTPTGDFDPALAGAGTYNVVYTVSDALTGCADTDTLVFTVNALPVAEAGNDVTICETESAQLNATGGTVYAWLPITDLSNAGIANPIATPTTTTQYTVEVTDANGCVASDSVLVTVAPLPVADFSATTACAGDPVVFANASTRAVDYNWSFGDNQTSTDMAPTHTYNTGGAYDVVLIATNGNCADTATVAVNVYNKPTASFTATPTRAEAGTDSVLFVADTAGIAIWLWDIGTGESFTQPSFSYVYQDTGLYTIGLIVANANGCTDTLLLPEYVEVIEPSRLFIPNAFTPNGDNRNDQLWVFGTGLDNIVFQIFNRWGEKVFETRDQAIGWDGTYKGEPVPPGVYVYKFTFNFPDLRLQTREGSITVIR